MVIRGFNQKHGIDYFDTYAPMARIATIKVLIALAAIQKLVIHQMDVKTAFSNGELEEEVYMKQPKGFVVPGRENKVCKLIRSLYGLNKHLNNGIKSLMKYCYLMGLVSMNLTNEYISSLNREKV